MNVKTIPPPSAATPEPAQDLPATVPEELRAMERVWDELAVLDPRARGRVLSWLLDKHEGGER